MTKRIGSLLLRQCSLVAVTSAIAVFSQTPAWAQNASGDVETVIVTGSHVISSFNSPTPVNVVDDARMQNLAIPNVADALNQLPSFRATTSNTSDLFRVSGTIGGNNVDLRGLSPTRTLVLVDGRRFVPESDSGTVDLNAIPSSLVKRSEVVTGGASAAYGADAVAGVVNLILDTKFEGFKADLSGGISGHGDDANTSVSAKYGDSFAGGRGHFLAGVEFQKNWGADRCETRSWCAKFTNYVPNPGYVGGVSTNGLPATLVLNNVNFVYSPNGILLSAVQTVGGVNTTLGQQTQTPGASNALNPALRNLQFNQGATALVPFTFGNYLSGSFMQGGDAAAGGDYGFGNVPLDTPTDHVSALAHVDYDINDSVSAFGEFIYSHVDGGNVKSSLITYGPAGGAAGLNINNPYITPSVRAQILAANPNITAINVNVVLTQPGDQVIASSANNTYRFTTGLKGDVFGDWHWDVSYEFGETTSRAINNNARLSSLDVLAQNAITPPAGYTGTTYTTPAGAPVICASSVASPSNGCVPVDPLGTQLTAAQIAKYESGEWQTRTIMQHDVMGNFRGNLFDPFGAGPIAFAIGGEYRYDSDSGQTDPQTLAGLFSAPQTTALAKVARNVVEGYIETNIPLITNKHLAKSMTVNLTGRETHYDTFGDAQPWKIGFEYEPNDTLLFRMTKSSDIRSPTAAESNPATITTNLPLNDPFGGGNHLIGTLTGGNANLHLETANTNTAGVVLKPDFIPGFNVSFDWYDITVKGAIDTVSAANILTACNTQNLLCNLITFSGAFKASPAVSVFSNFQNLSKVHAEGYELTADYTIPDVWNGAVNFSLNANYVLDLQSVGATGLITRMNGVTGNAGSLTTIAGVPSYKIDQVISYVEPGWSVTTHLRYVPQGILDPTKVGPNQPGYNVNLSNSQSLNMVGSAFYADLSGSVKLPDSMLGFGEQLEVYGAINNIIDTTPPKALRLFGNPLQFDPIGRAFRLGIRASL